MDTSPGGVLFQVWFFLKIWLIFGIVQQPLGPLIRSMKVPLNATNLQLMCHQIQVHYLDWTDNVAWNEYKYRQGLYRWNIRWWWWWFFFMLLLFFFVLFFLTHLYLWVILERFAFLICSIYLQYVDTEVHIQEAKLHKWETRGCKYTR